MKPKPGEAYTIMKASYKVELVTDNFVILEKVGGNADDGAVIPLWVWNEVIADEQQEGGEK
jgi:hypothetical protein